MRLKASHTEMSFWGASVPLEKHHPEACTVLLQSKCDLHTSAHGAGNIPLQWPYDGKTSEPLQCTVLLHKGVIVSRREYTILYEYPTNDSKPVPLGP